MKLWNVKVKLSDEIKEEMKKLREEIARLKEQLGDITEEKRRRGRGIYIDIGNHVHDYMGDVMESVAENIHGELEKSIFIGPGGVRIIRGKERPFAEEEAKVNLPKAAQIISALGEEHRLKILNALLSGGKYIDELETLSEITASTLSSHLKVLEEAGLVVQEKVRGRYLITMPGRTAYKMATRITAFIERGGSRMIWQHCQLDRTVLKSDERLTLLRTEKGVVEIGENTLAVPVKLDDQRKGFVFHGKGKLLLDAIVETEEGAIDKSVEEEISEPFLMLGGTEEMQNRLTEANKEDLMKVGYENEQDLLTKAGDLCNRFFGRTGIHNHRCYDENDGFVFAFPNKSDKLDILVAKGSKLVYKSLGRVFVLNRNEAILKTPDEVAIVGNGKSFVIKKKCC